MEYLEWNNKKKKGSWRDDQHNVSLFDLLKRFHESRVFEKQITLTISLIISYPNKGMCHGNSNIFKLHFQLFKLQNKQRININC